MPRINRTASHHQQNSSTTRSQQRTMNQSNYGQNTSAHHHPANTRSSRSQTNRNNSSQNHHNSGSTIPSMISSDRRNAHHSIATTHVNPGPITFTSNVNNVRINSSANVSSSSATNQTSFHLNHSTHHHGNLNFINHSDNDYNFQPSQAARMLSGSCASATINPFSYATGLYSMPTIPDLQSGQMSSGQIILPRKQFYDVKFIKHNSYEEVQILIKPQCIVDSKIGIFRSNIAQNVPLGDKYKVFLRFCKYSSSITEQMDCLPKSFNLTINESTFTIKNKYTFAPYDITSRVLCEKTLDIQIRTSIPDQNEYSEDYYYGVFLVKKVDHQKMLKQFKQKTPQDQKFSIDLVKKKLQSDDDVIVDNVIKVSLLCPLSAVRIRTPARSRQCEHVNCFDAESFISINEITPRWKCPICKIYIKIEDLIIDGLLNHILKNAPTASTDVQIFPDGTFEYLKKDGLKLEDSGNASSSGKNHRDKRSSSSASLMESSSWINDSKHKKIKSESRSESTETTVSTGNNKKIIECITIEDSDDEVDDNTNNNDKNNINDDNKIPEEVAISSSEMEDSRNSENPISPSSSDTIISTTDYSKYRELSDESSASDQDSAKAEKIKKKKKNGKNSITKDKHQDPNDGDDEDDDIEIIYEKIATNPSKDSTSKRSNVLLCTQNSSLNNNNNSNNKINHHPYNDSVNLLNLPHQNTLDHFENSLDFLTQAQAIQDLQTTLAKSLMNNTNQISSFNVSNLTPPPSVQPSTTVQQQQQLTNGTNGTMAVCSCKSNQYLYCAIHGSSVSPITSIAATGPTLPSSVRASAMGNFSRPHNIGDNNNNGCVKSSNKNSESILTYNNTRTANNNVIPTFSNYHPALSTNMTNMQQTQLHTHFHHQNNLNGNSGHISLKNYSISNASMNHNSHNNNSNQNSKSITQYYTSQLSSNNQNSMLNNGHGIFGLNGNNNLYGTFDDSNSLSPMSASSTTSNCSNPFMTTLPHHTVHHHPSSVANNVNNHLNNTNHLHQPITSSSSLSINSSNQNSNKMTSFSGKPIKSDSLLPNDGGSSCTFDGMDLNDAFWLLGDTNNSDNCQQQHQLQGSANLGSLIANDLNSFVKEASISQNHLQYNHQQSQQQTSAGYSLLQPR